MKSELPSRDAYQQASAQQTIRYKKIILRFLHKLAQCSGRASAHAVVACPQLLGPDKQIHYGNSKVMREPDILTHLHDANNCFFVG